MAGYINSAENWALFADAWDDELKSLRPKSISYLRMVEANSLREQFRGWSDADRDEKLRGLMRVARHFGSGSFHVSVSRQLTGGLLKPSAPRGLASPHFLCTFAVVSSVARFAAEAGIRMPIKFTFDRQDGVEDDMDLFFEHMTRNLPRAARQLIDRKPTYEDDKLFTPLQAADLLAWHLRRDHETHGSWTKGDASRGLLKFSAICVAKFCRPHRKPYSRLFLPT